MSSGKPKRFDLKSPYSPYIEKDQFKESDFFIHSRPPIKSKRPTSAKNNDTRSGKSFKTRKPIRPVSATK